MSPWNWRILQFIPRAEGGKWPHSTRVPALRFIAFRKAVQLPLPPLYYLFQLNPNLT